MWREVFFELEDNLLAISSSFGTIVEFSLLRCASATAERNGPDYLSDEW